jgi:hypothetical protein
VEKRLIIGIYDMEHWRTAAHRAASAPAGTEQRQPQNQAFRVALNADYLALVLGL